MSDSLGRVQTKSCVKINSLRNYLNVRGTLHAVGVVTAKNCIGHLARS